MTPLLVALSILLAVAAPAPAAETACPPPGGGTLRGIEPADGAFVATGRGWGHGAGMSQYGARGAARLGCTHDEILAAYYPGTARVRREDVPIRVGLTDGVAETTITALTGALRWRHCEESVCADLPSEQPQDAAWTVRVEADGSYVVADDDGDVWRGGTPVSELRVGLHGTVARVSTTGHRYRWGELELQSGAVANAAAMTVVVDLPTVEQYLYGLAEMPSSWEGEALQAQAVAGRTYAVNRRLAYGGQRSGCRCDVRRSTSDQYYSGYEKESEGPDGAYGLRWRSVVDLTAGKVVVHDGRPISAFYASSHGGYSESARFVWGSDVPYIRPLDDTRWEAASDNPNSAWTVAITAEQLGAAAGVGAATAVHLPDPRGYGGRVGDPERGYGGVVVEGTAGRATVSGQLLRTRLGLRSTLFDLEAAKPVLRVAGPDRVQTAVAASQAHWDASPSAVLATAATFPDALSGAALAARLDAPLLLTDPMILSEPVRAELDRLRVETVWILGGSSAVRETVEAQLTASGRTVRRLRGDDRYATAAAVAQEAGAPAAEAVVVLGDDWPDAVAAGAFAATPQRPPVVLVGRDRIPAATATALRALRIDTVTIVGGTAAVSAGVEQQLHGDGYAVRRRSGPSRWATSAAAAADALSRLTPPAHAVFASGQNFPDALGAGALAARVGGPLVLVPRDALSDAPPSEAFVRDAARSFAGGTIVGGRAAVSERVQADLDALLR